jgi:hypothetical protein
MPEVLATRPNGIFQSFRASMNIWICWTYREAIRNV